MKRIITLLFVCLLASTLSAQSVRLFHNGQPLNNGDYVNMQITPGEISRIYVEYTNVADDDVYVRVKRENINFIEGDVLTFCVGGSCSENTSAEFMVMSGDTIGLDDTSMVFHADYSSVNTDGSSNSLVKFTFYNTDNEEDAVTFYLYASQSVGIEHHEPVCQVSAYPNPATTAVNVRYKTSSNADSYLVIRNLVGSEVYRQPVFGEGKVQISTADMASGIYVYGIEEKGRMLAVKKLLVK